MAKTSPFDTYTDRYDTRFDRNEAAYASELSAFQELLPSAGRGLEIGVGTGRFAAPLGIQHGVDPSPKMRDRARERGITVKDGVAEALPYPDAHFDKALMTTTLCYLNAPAQAFREAYRVLRPGGIFVVGFVDGGPPLGQRYTRSDRTFYEDASFHRPRGVRALLETAGFGQIAARQTLFTDDPSAMETPDPVRRDFGAGGFVVMCGIKPA